jgi:hypothetical protein
VETDTASEQAGWIRRLVAVAMGCATAGFGAWAPWFVPDTCRWAGWLCLALFVPVGCVLVFAGVRGRAEDLRELSVSSFVQHFAGELVGVVFVALVIGLLAVFR